MRLLRSLGIAVVGGGLLAYVIGLGIYAVASTRGPVSSQPRNAAEAREAIRELGIGAEYPFENGFVGTPHGRMHYATAGQGSPVLCLHGNPTWSFLYREFLRGLSPEVRVIAPDLIGFGLSEKLPEVEAYTIEGHVDDVSALVEALELRDLTLVMQDWGGPIGLGVAARHPDRVRALVVMNTFGLTPPSMDGGPPVALRLLRIPVLGEQLIQGLGVFHRVFMRVGIAREERRREDVLRAYRDVQGSWEERAGTLAFPRLIPLDADDPSMQALERAGAFLEHFSGPVLLVWGMRDPAFRPGVLAEWRARFPRAPVLELPGAGHYLQEDAPEQIVPRIRRFLDDIDYQ